MSRNRWGRFLFGLMLIIIAELAFLWGVTGGCREPEPASREVPASVVPVATRSRAPNHDIKVDSAPMPPTHVWYSRWNVGGLLLVEPDKHGRPGKHWTQIPAGAYFLLIPHQVPDSAKVGNRARS